jgi:chromosome segregation protein
LFLKRLELVGFKSFAPRTVAEFEPGIVVVVGPNGSGKSNVADAVRWVLGEQSTRAVRARRPEELIFAGSAQRQPLGMAEVSLVLDNSDGALPLEYGEVRVSRRLYRSGESEYLLNGSRVRLRDITQLMLQVGLGSDGYGVIGQGAIDELILQKPEERRLAFESAADIRRYQLRLNDTRNRLSATEDNLARVQDVLAELGPHVRRLKTQAERAQRAESVRAELRRLQLTAFRIRLAHARRARARSEQTYVTAASELEQAEAATRRIETEARVSEQAEDALEARLATLRPRAEAFREQARTSERSLAVATERSGALVAQRTALGAELVRLTQRIEELRAEVATHAGDEQRTGMDTPEQSSAIASQRAQLQTLRQALAATTQALETARAAAEAAERRILRLEEQLTSGEERRRELDASHAVDEARLVDQRRQIETLAESTARLKHEVSVVQAEVVAAQRLAQQAAEERRQASQRADRLREAARVAARQADRLYGALEALGFPRTPPEHEERIRASTSLPPAWRQVLSGLPVLGIAGELAARVRPVDRLLRGYLMRIVVVADDAAAREAHRRLAAELGPTAPAWAVVSAEGLVLTALGERPIEDPADEGSAVADWKRQVRQLQAQRAEADAARQLAERQFEEAMAALTQATSADQTAIAAARGGEGRLQQLRRAEAQSSAELNHQRQTLERATRQVSTAADAQRHLNEQDRRDRETLATLRTERSAALARVRAGEEQVRALTVERDGAQTRLAAVEAERARRAAAVEARTALLTRLRNELESTKASVQAAEERSQQLANQAAELNEREVHLREELQAANAELATLGADLLASEEARRQQLTTRRTFEETLAAARASERGAHDRQAVAQVERHRTRDELERLEREVVDTGELEVDLPGGPDWVRQLRLELSTEAEEPTVDELALDMETLRRRIAVLQRESRAVGSVASGVLEEFRELAERHAFLERQSDDLRGAMTELRQAARELEGTMRERFARVFDAVNAAFQSCFRQLFGGGEARLVLTDPDDLLRTGVDIVARPPEKKLQGLLSLSGGERTLTIVALLFGLLEVNPTPFCVLDEVDAALDEANVGRFAELLGRFARQIQFVVVTHNRATMEQADALYGVTMDAEGISRLYSVEPRTVAAAASVGSGT